MLSCWKPSAKQPLQLTFEVVYGHAFKPAPKLAVRAQSEISLDQMRAALARGKAMGAARSSTNPGLDQHE